MEKFLEVAKNAALLAGRELMERMSKENEVFFKGAVDLVTQADKESQKIILEQITKYFPDHDILAEEDYNDEKGAEFRWIIDPLDGTTNYTHKFPVFAVSIALEKKGEVIVGVVYDPTREEMFWGLKGGGAYLNGKKIRVSSTVSLDKSILATGFPYDIRESEVNNLDNFSNFAVRVQAIRRCGSAAMDLCYVACGRFDGFWELKLGPWDVAAGALVVKEAGGRMSDFQNREFSVFYKETLASNQLIHQQMVEVLEMGKSVKSEM